MALCEKTRGGTRALAAPHHQWSAKSCHEDTIMHRRKGENFFFSCKAEFPWQTTDRVQRKEPWLLRGQPECREGGSTGPLLAPLLSLHHTPPGTGPLSTASALQATDGLVQVCTSSLSSGTDKMRSSTTTLPHSMPPPLPLPRASLTRHPLIHQAL